MIKLKRVNINFLHNRHTDKEMYTFILYVLHKHRAILGFPFRFLRIRFFIMFINNEYFKAISADIICKRSDQKIACGHSGKKILV